MEEERLSGDRVMYELALEEVKGELQGTSRHLVSMK
jgi:hypothetical protein